MYTLRENAMAIYNGEQPDFYGDIMDAVAIVPDPIFLRDACPQDGKYHKDSWGVTKLFRPGEPGETPRNDTDEYKVIRDIEDWRDELVVPPLDGLDWSAAEAFAKGVDRSEKFVCYFNNTGLFERSHFLMGMEDAFINYMEEPEEMVEMLKVIKDYKIENIRLAKEHLDPDVIFYQDDWGSKQNLFLPPDLWRETIKPLQREISDAIHECGMIYIHHSDCYCQPIVRDMVEIGIDIWQGAIPENDIPFIQRDTRENCDHQLRIEGGIDTPAVDIEGMGEDDVRASVRRDMDRCLPGGYMYMGCPGGRAFTEPNNTWLQSELRRYGRQWAVEHPVGEVLDDGFDADELESWFGEKTILPTDNA
jgi:hypothetical protein